MNGSAPWKADDGLRSADGGRFLHTAYCYGAHCEDDRQSGRECYAGKPEAVLLHGVMVSVDSLPGSCNLTSVVPDTRGIVNWMNLADVSPAVQLRLPTLGDTVLLAVHVTFSAPLVLPVRLTVM